MINENWKIIKDSFLKYYADQKFLILFLISLIFIGIMEEKKRNKSFLVYYEVILFIIVLNPLFAFLLLNFITKSVYYRFFWIVPFGIVIAYFGTELISKSNSRSKKAIGVIAFLLLIIYCGNFVYTDQVFKKVDNWYKLPDEYIEVIQTISEIPVNNKKAMVSTNLVGFIRQYDATIKLAYQRRPYEDYDRNIIVSSYKSGNIQNLVKLCKEQNVNIIVYDKEIQLSEPLQNYGFELYKEVDKYDIYFLNFF